MVVIAIVILLWLAFLWWMNWGRHFIKVSIPYYKPRRITVKTIPRYKRAWDKPPAEPEPDRFYRDLDL